MSDPALDALAQMARNRGLKLVRSRVRTPGKRRFGKVGLTDAPGTPVFGMDAGGPMATPVAIENYLRSLEAQDWGASLDPPKQRKAKADEGQSKPGASRTDAAGGPRSLLRAAVRSRTESAPTPRPQPQPVVRTAQSADSPRLAELIRELGHDIDATQVSKNLAALVKSGEVPLVATLDGQIVGLCGIGTRVVISRPAPLGRITSLIVTADAQGHGIGRMLVEAAEARMREQGCALVEVTSNDKRAAAHAFYRHLGYERTSIRFAKPL